MRQFFIIGLIIIFIILIGLLSIMLYLPKNRIPYNPPEPEPPPKIILPKVLYNLAGVIQKLEKDSFSFEATIPLVDEEGQPISKTELRIVKITELTKFSILTFIETEPGRKTPKETPLTFKDLKVGDYIEVLSNRDISQAKEFEATQIRILPR